MKHNPYLQFCSACHYGFSDEKLARTHELAGIGCERCHGKYHRINLRTIRWNKETGELPKK